MKSILAWKEFVDTSDSFKEFILLVLESLDGSESHIMSLLTSIIPFGVPPLNFSHAEQELFESKVTQQIPDDEDLALTTDFITSIDALIDSKESNPNLLQNAARDFVA